MNVAGASWHFRFWPLSALSVVVILLLALVDGYHSWLCAKVFERANNIETIMRYDYALLARGDVDPQAKRDFEVKIESHHLGRYWKINKKFSLADRRDARPRLILVVLYSMLLACAVASGILIYFSAKKAAASITNLDCTLVVAGANLYVCKPK